MHHMPPSDPPRPSFFAIPIDVKRRLKIAAARTGRTMRGIVTAAVVAELERLERDERDSGEAREATGT